MAARGALVVLEEQLSSDPGFAAGTAAFGLEGRVIRVRGRACVTMFRGRHSREKEFFKCSEGTV